MAKIFVKMLFLVTIVTIVVGEETHENNEGMCTKPPEEGQEPTCGGGSSVKEADVTTDTKKHNPAQQESLNRRQKPAPVESLVTPSDYTIGTGKDEDDLEVTNEEPKQKYTYKPHYDEEWKYKLKYKDLFFKQGHEWQTFIDSVNNSTDNTTDYYDFSLDTEEINSLKWARISSYPNRKFRLNNKGNFLHFMKIAYEKELPVFFTADNFLQGFIKSKQRSLEFFYEEVYIHLFKKILDKMIDYIIEVKNKPEFKQIRFSLDNIQVFYTIAKVILVHKLEEVEIPQDIRVEFDNWVKKIGSFSKAEVFILGNKKTVQYLYLIPKGIFKKQGRLQNLFKCIQFLSVHKFFFLEEMRGIWILGKLIDASGSASLYKDINRIHNYLYGQGNVMPNMLEIYEIGTKVLKLPDSKWVLTDSEYSSLTEEIKKHKVSLKIKPFNEWILITKELFNAFAAEKEGSTSFLSLPVDIDLWIINKITNMQKESKRKLVSYFEMNYMLTNNEIMKTIIYNRIKGIKSFEGDYSLPLRDQIDYSELMEVGRKALNTSFVEDEQAWRDNINTNLYLALFKLNQKTDDPDDLLYKKPEYIEKNFFTAFTSVIEHKKDVLLVKKEVAYKPIKGSIPEVMVEKAVDFWMEMKMWIYNMEQMYFDFIQVAENQLKIKLTFARNQIGRIIADLKHAINLIVKSIDNQIKKKFDPETKEELRKLLYVEELGNVWEGWFARLYDVHKQDELFNFEGFMNRIQVVGEDKEQHFGGSIYLTYMRNNYIGVSMVTDREEKVNKLMLYSSYGGHEHYKRLIDTKDFNDVQKAIVEGF